MIIQTARGNPALRCYYSILSWLECIHHTLHQVETLWLHQTGCTDRHVAHLHILRGLRRQRGQAGVLQCGAKLCIIVPHLGHLLPQLLQFRGPL